MLTTLLHALALGHAVVLVAGAAVGVRRYAGSLGHKVAAAFLLIWTNLILTALGLGLLGQLGHLRWYVPCSCLLALLTAALSWQSSRTTPGTGPTVDDAPLRPTPLVVFAVLSLVLALAGSLTIAAFDYPTNYDSIAYRFPRPYLYLAQGHLGQPNPGIDFRICHYPLNGALGYLFLAAHGLDARFFTLPSILCWLAAGLGVWLLARAIGATRQGSLVAVTVYLLSPVVLVCATSGNDEVIAAAPLLLGVVFLHRWWQTGTRADALLGAVGAGIGLGTKLHWMFYVGYVPLVLAALVWHLGRAGKIRVFLRQRAVHLAGVAVIVLGLSCPFLIANLRGSGHLVNPPQVVAAIANRPFQPRVALINAEIYTAQLFLSPFPDLMVSRDAAAVTRCYQRFNDFLAPAFAWFDTSDAYAPPWYQFHGVAPLMRWQDRYSEFSLWVGLTPYLLLLALGCLFLRRRHRPARLAGWLALGFFAWHLGNVAITRYVDCAGVYYAYPLTLAAAGLAVIWDLGAGRLLLRSAFVVVLVAHVLVAVNIFGFSYQRSLTDIVRSNFTPRDVRIDPAVVRILGSTRAIDIVYTEWEFQSFHLIHQSPRTRYRLIRPTDPARQKALRLYCLPANTTEGFFEIPFPGQAMSRLALLGNMDTIHGPERVFAVNGTLPGAERSEQCYIALRATPTSVHDERWQEAVHFDGSVFGLADDEAIELKVEQVFPDDGQRLIADWQSPGQLAAHDWPIMPSGGESQLSIQVRSASEPHCCASTFVPLANQRFLDPVAPELFHLHSPAEVSVAHLGPANSEGFGSITGPFFPQLPRRVRWMNVPRALVRFQGGDEPGGEVALHFRAIRNIEQLVVRVNGQEVLRSAGPSAWEMRDYRTDSVVLHAGENLLEFEAAGGVLTGTDPGLRVLFEELSFEKVPR